MLFMVVTLYDLIDALLRWNTDLHWWRDMLNQLRYRRHSCTDLLVWRDEQRSVLCDGRLVVNDVDQTRRCRQRWAVWYVRRWC